MPQASWPPPPQRLKLNRQLFRLQIGLLIFWAALVATAWATGYGHIAVVLIVILVVLVAANGALFVLLPWWIAWWIAWPGRMRPSFRDSVDALRGHEPAGAHSEAVHQSFAGSTAPRGGRLAADRAVEPYLGKTLVAAGFIALAFMVLCLVVLIVCSLRVTRIRAVLRRWLRQAVRHEASILRHAPARCRWSENQII